MPAVPYNPLDKQNIAESIVQKLLARSCEPLPKPKATLSRLKSEAFEGAGIYAIYYFGTFDLYANQAQENRDNGAVVPIYVGKADPQGGRRGEKEMDASIGTSLYNRLKDHATSIEHATNLEFSDFCCRYLVVDEVWIDLAERLAIRQFVPLWNTIIDGFGNHAPGKGRVGQRKSDWDVLHPGRQFAKNLAPGRSEETIRRDVNSRHSRDELAQRAARITSEEGSDVSDE